MTSGLDHNAGTVDYQVDHGDTRTDTSTLDKCKTSKMGPRLHAVTVYEIIELETQA